MNEVQNLEKQGFLKERNFKTEVQANDYAKRLAISGKTTKVVPDGSQFMVMSSTKTTPANGVIASWNEFVSLKLPDYKKTMPHKEAMQQISADWKDYKTTNFFFPE